MVVFVGNKLRLGGLEQVVKQRLDDTITYIEENPRIENQENDILAVKNPKYIIYDIDQYFTDSDLLIEAIRRIKKTNGATPILYVATDNPKNEVIKEAVTRQIKNFINESRSLGEQKNQFEKILSGYYEVNEREDIKEVEKEVEEENNNLRSFVGELFNAKLREDKKEKTVIINKKSNTEIFLSVLANSIRAVFSVASISLITLAIITLIYTESRQALFSVLGSIYEEIITLIGM